MQIIYVGPFSAVRFFDQGTEREVAHGEAVEVHPDTAGRAPSGDDLGAGLLAQPTNWQPAPAAKSKTTSKDGE